MSEDIEMDMQMQAEDEAMRELSEINGLQQEIQDLKQVVRECIDALKNALEGYKCICGSRYIHKGCPVHAVLENPTVKRVMQEGDGE